MLLEKAMAKFKGSYAALDGGSTLWALEVLTGDTCFKFNFDQKVPIGLRLCVVSLMRDVLGACGLPAAGIVPLDVHRHVGAAPRRAGSPPCGGGCCSRRPAGQLQTRQSS